METSNIQISKENALAAYKNATDEGKQLLENLFGKELFTPKDVTERIKTFEDALNELGENNILVRQYRAIVDADDELELDCNDGKDVIALLKLRIICAALNEGWTPKFTTDEYRYYPYFVFYTQSEIDKMDEEDKGRVRGRSYGAAYAYAGVDYSFTNRASVYSHTNSGARLCFFKRELAKYAGEQFLDIWADFIWPEINDGTSEK